MSTSKAVGAVVSIASVAGFLLGVFDVVGGTAAVIVSLVLLAVGVVLVVSDSARSGGTRLRNARLVKGLADATQLRFIDGNLNSMFLNGDAVKLYKGRSKSLHIDSFVIEAAMVESQVSMRLRMKGRNASKQPVSRMPVMMFGGSIRHLDALGSKCRSAVDHKTSDMRPVEVFDNGNLVVVDYVFQTPLKAGQKFEVIQDHLWPGAMLQGRDIIYLPYALLFEREIGEMSLSVKFDGPVANAIGYRSSWLTGDTEESDTQPAVATSQPDLVKWDLASPGSDLYSFVFDRGN